MDEMSCNGKRPAEEYQVNHDVLLAADPEADRAFMKGISWRAK